MASVAPVVITTTNVKDALKTFSTRHKIPIELLSFDLIAYNTFFRLAPSKQWIKIDQERKKKILNSRNATNPALKFIEQYKLRIYKKEYQQLYTSQISLQSTKHKTKIFAMLKKSPLINKDTFQLAEFIQEVQRKLIYSGFLLGLYAVDIERVLQPFILDLKENKLMSEDYSFIISQAINPSQNNQGKLISHFLLKQKDERRAYEAGVDADELIIEYIYPQVGATGRDCKGTILKPEGTAITSCMLIYFDPTTIKLIAYPDRAHYYALKKGFVNFEDQNLRISNELELEHASFKTTGSITLGANRDIALKINQSDSSKDALNRGVAIDVSNVDIRGSIADNTSIKADQVSIHSHTHKNSNIEAKSDANVNLHRGNLKTHNATIGKLEFGLVEADIVHVKEVLGGEIRAREIYIEVLHSKAKLIASDIIKVKKIRGKNNTFIIAPQKIESLENHILHTHQEIQSYERKTLGLHNQMDKLIKKIEADYGAIELVQKEVATAIRSGKEQPVLAATKVRQYGIDTQKSEEIAQELHQATAELEHLRETAQKQKDALSNAQIIYNDYWDSTQEIFFEHSDSTKVEKIIPEGFRKVIVYKDLSEAELIPITL